MAKCNPLTMAAYNHGIMIGRFGVDPLMNGQTRAGLESDGDYWYGTRPKLHEWFMRGFRFGRAVAVELATKP